MQHAERWTERKITQRLDLIEPLVYRRRALLPSWRYTELAGPMVDPPVGVDVDDSAWAEIAPDAYWSDWATDFALRGAFTVPAEWPQDAQVALYLPLGVWGSFSHPEALVYVDGVSYATADRHHQEILLPEKWRDGQSHKLALAGWTGYHKDPEGQLFMRECAVVQIDQPTRDLAILVRVALGAVQVLEDLNPAKGRLLNALDAAFKVLDIREPFGDAFYASVPEAYQILRAGVDQAGSPMDVDIIGAGHAHIDVAWLWTLGQTRRKSGRTFHTVMRLMEQFPDYHFTQSQPQLYDYVRQDYPELFEDIKARVADGRWEPLGGMWVEADCNLSGAESLARQFLLGRSFYREHFGTDVESPVLWLPDVFGYSWAMPQLIKQAGLDYFFTIKIGWNQYNRLPYDSFWWQGLDGTRVLTAFSTTPEPTDLMSKATYNAYAAPETAYGTWLNSQHKDEQTTHLMSYGYGDGGGGPTREMIENINELANFPAMPSTSCGKVGDFFRRLESESGETLPLWNGELYLEYHRGTYTTQAKNKWANRKSEFLLHDAEFLATLAGLVDETYQYPAQDLHKAWELVCLNQFHDIIPGSSITEVYVESQEQYAEVYQLGVKARDEALQTIAAKIGGALVVANTTAFTRQDMTFWPETLADDQHYVRADGTPVYTQAAEGGVWIAPGELVPYSVLPLTLAAGSAPVLTNTLTATPTLLENDFVRVELNDAGDIVRVYDKQAAREVMAEGGIANQFQAFEDRPLAHDAWDIEVYFEDKMWLSDPATSVAVVAQGPLRATLAITRQILGSSYTQLISLAYNSPQITFQTKIDWHEDKVLLKVAFPVDVLAPAATHEIQWGNVQRPTHKNTSWDWARFETAAQKWVDLSEGGYGVSLLNDCKYGHDIQGNVMRLSLLRSPSLPDPTADRGQHTFTYSLLPHADGWEAVTPAAAYQLNDPLVVLAGAGAEAAEVAPTNGLFAFDEACMVIETIKRAEDGAGMIVRCYESQRRRGPVTLRPGFSVAAAWRTNLLEDNQEAVAVNEDGSLTLNVKPFEIITLRLQPA